MSDRRKSLLKCVSDSLRDRYAEGLDLDERDIEAIANGIAEDVWSEFDIKEWVRTNSKKRR